MDKALKKNIAIIIPYFGKWPVWIDLYLYSCKQNRNIDWHFFTDCELPADKDENIYFQQISFVEYCQKVSLKLNFQFAPHSPYKLCGLKPFYGFIHSDILSNYEFWGFGDIDVIWGDLDKFYYRNMFENYDLFSTHADRVSGHLAIIRNKPYYTNLCFQIKNWKEKLESQDAIPLDEQDFSWLLYPESRNITRFYSKVIRKLFNWRDAWVIYYNTVPFINSLLRIKKRRFYFKEQHTTPILGNDGRSFQHDAEEWLYKDGKIYNQKNGHEYIYMHFMIYKKNSFRDDYFWKESYYNLPVNYDYSKGVIINKKGFFPVDEVPG